MKSFRASVESSLHGPRKQGFGEQLQMWRRRSGMSQLDLANFMGSSPRHLTFIETGRSRPGRELVLRLAEALDVPVRERNTAPGLVSRDTCRAVVAWDVSPEERTPCPTFQRFSLACSA